MNNWHYEPKKEILRGFFSETKDVAGLDSKEKVYAFLLGTVFGKLMEIQAAKGVNVGSNALTWLKRLSMTGTSLPELYIKVREKFFSYGVGLSKNSPVGDVIEEIGYLGAQITEEDLKKLNKIDANYYLLLGQSVAKTLIPAKEGGENDE